MKYFLASLALTYLGVAVLCAHDNKWLYAALSVFATLVVVFAAENL